MRCDKNLDLLPHKDRSTQQLVPARGGHTLTIYKQPAGRHQWTLLPLNCLIASKRGELLFPFSIPFFKCVYLNLVYIWRRSHYFVIWWCLKLFSWMNVYSTKISEEDADDEAQAIEDNLTASGRIIFPRKLSRKSSSMLITTQFKSYSISALRINCNNVPHCTEDTPLNVL